MTDEEDDRIMKTRIQAVNSVMTFIDSRRWSVCKRDERENSRQMYKHETQNHNTAIARKHDNTQTYNTHKVRIAM